MLDFYRFIYYLYNVLKIKRYEFIRCKRNEC